MYVLNSAALGSRFISLVICLNNWGNVNLAPSHGLVSENITSSAACMMFLAPEFAVVIVYPARFNITTTGLHIEMIGFTCLVCL